MIVEQIENQFPQAGKCQSDSELKRRMFERFLKGLEEMRFSSLKTACCLELNPDVIVIFAARTVMFETQNMQASAWLHRRFGFDGETSCGRERIRVHPTECRNIIGELKAAGFAVAY